MNTCLYIRCGAASGQTPAWLWQWGNTVEIGRTDEPIVARARTPMTPVKGVTCPQVIVPEIRRFSHEDAERVVRTVAGDAESKRIVIDFRNTPEVTTAAFARLVLFRRELLRNGRDLRLSGMRGRTLGLYELSRLHDALPCE